MVLTYHAVGNGADAVSAVEFREHMRVLQEEATVVSPKDLLSRVAGPGERFCAITFDDGYCGVHEHAAGVLAGFGFAAALFVCSAFLDSERNFPAGAFEGLHPDEHLLSWRQVDELSKGGFTIGSHLTEHIDITAVTESDARDALSRSRETIETRLGIKCEMLAYPWGCHNAVARRLAKSSGYTTAFTTEHACVPATCDQFRVPRMHVCSEYKAADLAAMIRGDWDFLRLWSSLRAATSSKRKMYV
jgi:peptidoglycan/xylan/chitin deacetylase (PgdA/CDA1 family)